MLTKKREDNLSKEEEKAINNLLDFISESIHKTEEESDYNFVLNSCFSIFNKILNGFKGLESNNISEEYIVNCAFEEAKEDAHITIGLLSLTKGETNMGYSHEYQVWKAEQENKKS